MIQQKKRDKCRQVWRWKKLAHPWFETTVTFVDNVFLKEEKNFIPKQTETSCDQNNIWDKYFLMIQQKKRDKCDDETKRAIPGLKQLKHL